MPEDRRGALGGKDWRTASIIPGLFFPQSSSPPHTQADLTSILHICTPGVVMLRELLTWALSLVMATSLRGKKCERKD